MHSKLPLLIGLTAAVSLPAQIHLQSPNHQIETVISQSGGQLIYSVKMGGRDVLKPSPIGVTVDGVRYGSHADLGQPEHYSVNERYPWLGAKSEILNHCEGAKITVKEGNGGQSWQLEVRCYDDGVAYRCAIPGEGSRKVTAEAAAWVLPDGTKGWFNPDTANYEGIHVHAPVNQVPADSFKNGIGMPVTLELPGGGFAAITEAETMAYSGMTLESSGSWTLRSSFRDNPDGWMMTGRIVTPWRIVMAAPDLNTLVNCEIVPNVSPAPDRDLFPQGAHTDWIKPGRCLWQWWAYNDPGTHWSRQKGFVDQAAKLNCQYYLVDEGWEHTRQEWAADGKTVWDRLKELCDYAADKHVGIWVWRGWTYNQQRQWPGLETAAKREDFFRRCAEVGVKGAKIDFMDSESHDVLEFYQDCLRAAARHQIMVDFHGANKPAGEQRTWPNEMTREGIRGLEYNKWSTLPPQHYATLPFTRYLAGNGDFTPTTFQRQFLKGTTFALQLAAAVVYTSPFLCWADKPDVYLESPALDLIQTMPTVWDETRVLKGSVIGELAVFARRSGEDWYVGIINGGKARDYDLDLAFLGSGNYQADVFADVPEKPAAFDVQNGVALKSTDHRTIHLNDGGGWVARIKAH